jgi:hypothetical protein
LGQSSLLSIFEIVGSILVNILTSALLRIHLDLLRVDPLVTHGHACQILNSSFLLLVHHGSIGRVSTLGLVAMEILTFGHWILCGQVISMLGT